MKRHFKTVIGNVDERIGPLAYRLLSDGFTLRQ
jgi:hypothetical protein